MGSSLADHTVAATRVGPRASRWLVLLSVPVLLIAMLVASMQSWSIAYAATESTVGNCTNDQDFATIQSAVNAAVSGTIINICPAEYVEAVNLSQMNQMGDITLRRVPGQVGEVVISPVVSPSIYITPNNYFVGNITLDSLVLSSFDYGIDFGSYITDDRWVYGSVILNNINATENNDDGAFIAAAGAVTVTNSSFTDNFDYGLYVEIVPNMAMDSVVQLELPNVYVENVVADFNGNDGIYIGAPQIIQVYDTSASNNGFPNQVGYLGASGIYIDNYDYYLRACGLDAQVAQDPYTIIQSVSANDNLGAWGIYVDSTNDVYIYDTETINNPYDGVAVLSYDDCEYTEIELVNSLAMSNGWASAYEQTAVGEIDPAYSIPDFGGFRLVSGGDLYVYSSEDALEDDFPTKAIGNEKFGYCLQADGESEVLDSWAVDNRGDGFKYSYGYECEYIFSPAAAAAKHHADKAIVEDTEDNTAEPRVGVNLAPYETLVISNASAIANGGAGFAVSDSSLLITFTNISALRNITGVEFGEATMMPYGQVTLDEVDVLGEGISGPTHIMDSLIQSNTNYGLMYKQLIYQPTGAPVSIEGIDSLTSTHFISSSIVCENGEGLGAVQYEEINIGSINPQLLPGDHILTVDARGNWWGHPTGPFAMDNLDGQGDSIVVENFNPAVAANTASVQYNPWIDTIFDSAQPNPTLVGIPVAVDYRFGEATLTYFLENGVGNPHEGPIFTLRTNNGVVNGEAGKYIENTYIEGSATPATAGTMSIQLDGPCGLDSTQNVQVASPSISVLKSPDAQGVAAGDSAVFTITVINTGDITLTNISVTDPIAPSCSFAAGSFDDLGVGQSSTYSCALNNVTNNLVNTVTAQGFASIDNAPAGNAVSDSDSVNVFVASFELTKTVYVDGYNEVIGEDLFNPSDCALNSTITVPTGTTMKYCYTISNTGDYTLSTHSLVDSHFPNAILTNFPQEVGPGASFSTVDAGVQVTKTLTVSTTNIATWTAEIAAPLFSLDADAVMASIPVVVNASATVTISSPDLDQDGDGIPDEDEGSGDINTNGIPDFLDPAGPTNEPPTEQPNAPGDLFLPSLGNN